MVFCVWSGLPGHADNNVFNLAELPPLPIETSQLTTLKPLRDRSLPTDGNQRIRFTLVPAHPADFAVQTR